MNYFKDFNYDFKCFWFVCVFLFIVQFIIFGIYSFVGIFFIVFDKEFYWSEFVIGMKYFDLFYFELFLLVQLINLEIIDFCYVFNLQCWYVFVSQMK